MFPSLPEINFLVPQFPLTPGKTSLMMYSQRVNFISQFDHHSQLNHNFYAPNFKEVEEAYWFGLVRGVLRFAYGQERLEIGS